MNIEELINKAKTTSGMNLGQMASEMHMPQSKFTAWKKGEYKPCASEIAYLAEKARLSILETLAEIEGQMRPDLADVWQRAVQQIRQNQGLSLLLSIGRKIRHKLQAKQRQKRKARYGPFSIRRAKGRVQLYCRRRGDVPDASFDRSPSE